MFLDLPTKGESKSLECSPGSTKPSILGREKQSKISVKTLHFMTKFLIKYIFVQFSIIKEINYSKVYRITTVHEIASKLRA